MQRAVYFIMGVLLMIAAVFLAWQMLQDRDLLVLAAVSPAIIAAFAYGATLLLRAFAPPR